MKKLLDFCKAWFDRHPNKYINYETVTYLIFGVLSTVVNYVVYYAAVFAGVHYVTAQVIAWIAAVVFAYFTNRRYVFESTTKGKVMAAEFVKFSAARIITLLIETLIMVVFVEKAGISDKIIKIPASVITVVLNYVFSKLFIFKKEKADGKDA